MTATATNSSLLGLDVGDERIGVALARSDVRIPQPHATLANTPEVFTQIKQLIAENSVGQVIVGLPRGLNGQSTDQTRQTELFIDELKKHVVLPVHMQDEALTSQKAETELNARRKPYTKGDIDALAATYILEDFIGELPGGQHG